MNPLRQYPTGNPFDEQPSEKGAYAHAAAIRKCFTTCGAQSILAQASRGDLAQACNPAAATATATAMLKDKMIESTSVSRSTSYLNSPATTPSEHDSGSFAAHSPERRHSFSDLSELKRGGPRDDVTYAAPADSHRQGSGGQHIHLLATRLDPRNAAYYAKRESELMAAVAPEDMSEATASFVLPEHLKVFLGVTEQLNCCISIRETGEDSLRMLRLRAGPKPHDILEKSIKPSSLAPVFGTRAEEVYERLRHSGLAGAVGHWAYRNGKPTDLIGVYVEPAATGERRARDDLDLLTSHLRKTPDGRHRYLPLDVERIEAADAILRRASFHSREMLTTGDYDLHDLHQVGNGRLLPVPSESPAEHSIVHFINSVIQAGSRRGYDPRARVVQHGPQQNFPANQYGEGKGRNLVCAVARPSFPLLMVRSGEAEIVRNEADHKAYFKRHNMVMKLTWSGTGGPQFEPSEPGTDGSIVKLSRKSAPLADQSPRQAAELKRSSVAAGEAAARLHRPDWR